MRISDMAMIDPERKETIQRSSSASLGFHKSNVFPYSSQGGGNFIQGFPDFKSEINVHTSGYQEADSPIMMMSPVPLNNDYVRIPYNQDFYPQAIFHHEKVQQNQWGYLENYCNSITRDYTFPVGDGIQNAPFNMFAPTYSHGYQFQEFQYFVVIDFEATCDKEQIPQPQEIIEFPSVLVNSMTGQLEASFQTYVRPAYNQNLTDFCKELTGIQQIQVDRGVPLSEALLMHDKWLEDKGIKKTNFAIVTWSNWDCRVMLDSECRFKRIRKPPYFNRWINLKLPFHNVFGPARCNLKEAVQLAGLAWEGRAHCGLDDARNTARLLALMMRQGFRFSITNSLAWQSADHPTLLQASPTGQLGPISSPPKHKHLLVPSPFHPHAGERHTYCFCGVMSSKCIVRKPGPKHGRLFFGCGKWTVTRGALCSYFEWAS